MIYIYENIGYENTFVVCNNLLQSSTDNNKINLRQKWF